jgi:hypothetical protein
MNASQASGTALLERPAASARSPRAVLLDVTPGVRERLVPALQHAGFEVRLCEAIEQGVLDVDVVVIEADRGARMLSETQALRGVLEHGCIASVVGWWSEYEADLLHAADVVLHVPLREDDLRAALAAIQHRLFPTGRS